MSLLLDALKKAALEKEQSASKIGSTGTALVNSSRPTETTEPLTQEYLASKQSVENSLEKIEILSSGLKQRLDLTEHDIQSPTPNTVQSDIPLLDDSTEIDLSDIHLDPGEFVTLEEPQSVENELFSEQRNAISGTAVSPDADNPTCEPAGATTETSENKNNPFGEQPSVEQRPSIRADEVVEANTDTDTDTEQISSVADQRKAALAKIIDANAQAIRKKRKHKQLIVCGLILLSTMGVGLYGYQTLSPLFISSQDVVSNIAYSSDEKSDDRALVQNSEVPPENISELSALNNIESTNHAHSTSQNKNFSSIKTTLAETQETLAPVNVSTTHVNNAILEEALAAASGPKHEAILGARVTVERDASTAIEIKPTSVSKSVPARVKLADSNTIKPANDLSHNVLQGYKAWKEGRWDDAERYYAQAVSLAPSHRDALLGAAAVASERGNHPLALKFYQSRLAVAPKDEFALAGILNLVDVELANNSFKSELNSLIAEYPQAGHLHYLQGVIYASNQQWHAAQKAFFNAWQRDPSRADYVFNLAVSLDHLDLTDQAIEFYGRARQMAFSSAHTFSVEELTIRLSQLKGDLQ